MTTPAEVAAAFSSHRFAEAYASLAPNVRWVAVGQSTTEGVDAVRAVCESTTAELADVRTEFGRFVVVAGNRAVAVDVIGRYTAADGTVSVVSSCDIYEFDGDVVQTITSYAVEIDDDWTP